MKHYILAKWNESVCDKAELLKEVRELFGTTDTIPGVRGAEIYPCCIDRANRYDLMIVLDMEKEALSAWDASPLHHRWKDIYGARLEKKAIFDHEV